MDVGTPNFLAGVDLFSQVEPSRLDSLAERLRRRAFRRGAVSFHQGDSGDRLYFVVAGLVKISMVSPDGRETDIALLKPGDCCGEMSLLDGGLRSATAVAVEPTETLTLSREEFLAFLNDHPQVALQIINLLIRRLRAMNETVGDLVFLDVPSRVAKKLLELADVNEDGSDNSGHVSVLLSQEELSRL